MSERKWGPIREHFWTEFEKTYDVKPDINCPECGCLPKYESFNYSNNAITINYSFKCHCACGHEFEKTVVYRA